MPRTATSGEHPSLSSRRLARAWWLTIGLLCVAIGSIGAVVPGLPTTVFFLAAAWCFGRSNRRFEQWVLDLPGIGPLVRDARNGLGMPRRVKLYAVSMIWVAISISAFALSSRPWAALLVVALGLVGTGYIARFVPTREHVLAAGTGRGRAKSVPIRDRVPYITDP